MSFKSTVDYGVYLVTDSTPAILGSKDIVEIVRAALRGGVTCVQYREKLGEHDRTRAIETARKIHAVTKEAGVPLLINDHVDIAAELDCEGVHIGQDDMGG